MHLEITKVQGPQGRGAPHHPTLVALTCVRLRSVTSTPTSAVGCGWVGPSLNIHREVMSRHTRSIDANPVSTYRLSFIPSSPPSWSGDRCDENQLNTRIACTPTNGCECARGCDTYSSPPLSSHVTTWPSASCSSFTGMPPDMMMQPHCHRQRITVFPNEWSGGQQLLNILFCVCSKSCLHTFGTSINNVGTDIAYSSQVLAVCISRADKFITPRNKSYSSATSTDTA